METLLNDVNIAGLRIFFHSHRLFKWLFCTIWRISNLHVDGALFCFFCGCDFAEYKYKYEYSERMVCIAVLFMHLDKHKNHPCNFE